MVDTFTTGDTEDDSPYAQNDAQLAAKLTAQRDALRKRVRTVRRALNAEQLQRAANLLTPNVLSVIDTLWTQASTADTSQAPPPLQRIAGYLAFQGEIDVAPTMDALRKQGVTTYVPMLDGETLSFAEWNEETPYTTNRFGIVEPCVDEANWVGANDIDAVLVPLVAFDNTKQRMGMGGGFYDKTFAKRGDQPGPPWLIGVAHSLQLVDTVYPAWWDVALDYVVTDEGMV